MNTEETLLERALEKEKKLLILLTSYPSLAVAYSGGLDSTYLAAVAVEALGSNAKLIIADSPSIPRSELESAIQIANERHWNLQVIRTHEHQNPNYLANAGDRCFHCKTELFSRMQAAVKAANGVVLAHGAVEDDKSDIRPGTQAAANHQVVAPLQEVQLYKSEVRLLSGRRGLPTADKASFACLGSRFPTGTPIDLDKMRQIEAAEELLKQRGYRQYRVRHHGNLCRIETDEAELERLVAGRAELVPAIKALGYRFVTLDLTGYVTGSTA
jgi:pyridinium-3,5-biscarboxylic acid mononucleotide sulfurtransferase